MARAAYRGAMLETVEVLSGARRALRRAVDIECQVIGPDARAPTAMRATNLSPFGVWIEVDEPFAAIDERIEGAGDVVAVDAEIEREVVAGAGRDACVGKIMFGGDFGGKSRNCPYWWLGRKCYVFYLPERIYREPELRAPILQALERPCDFLFDPAFAADGTEETIRKFDRRARNAFGCNGQLLPLQQEVKVYVIDENDRYTVETVVMKL